MTITARWGVIVRDSQISLVLTKGAAGAVVLLTVTACNFAGESPTGNNVKILVS